MLRSKYQDFQVENVTVGLFILLYIFYIIFLILIQLLER